MKKVLSILTVTLFIGAYAAPVFAQKPPKEKSEVQKSCTKSDSTKCTKDKKAGCCKGDKK